MTERYTNYLVSLSNRDGTLLTLAGLAVALVLAYIGLSWIPPRYSRILRIAYLSGGVVLFLGTLVLNIWGVK